MNRKLIRLAIGVVLLVLPPTESQSADPGKMAKPAADPMLGKEAGQVRDDNGLKTKLVWCPPGFVTMEIVEYVTEPADEQDDEPYDDEVVPDDGSPSKPRTTIVTTPVKVLLTHGYWLGQYEVTQSEWKQAMKTEAWKTREFTKEGADYPARWVSWNDATDFCSKLTEQERQVRRLSNYWEYTLPTEAVGREPKPSSLR